MYRLEGALQRKGCVQDLWDWGATPVGGTGAAGEPGYATGTTAARGSAGTDLSKGEKSSTS